MSIERSIEYLTSTVRELLKLPREAEWVEFKHNNEDPDAIGEYISALSNSAALLGKTHGYLLWGVDDDSQEIVGTSFKPHAATVGKQELESWLLCLLAPKLNFRFYAFEVESKPVVLLEVTAAFRHPVQFKGIEYIRVGSYKKKLKDYTEKERELWRIFDHTPFEQQIAVSSVSADEILQLLDYTTYFELLDLPLPEGREKPERGHVVTFALLNLNKSQKKQPKL
jgi:predicted HTH transcriptional regulator